FLRCSWFSTCAHCALMLSSLLTKVLYEHPDDELAAAMTSASTSKSQTPNPKVQIPSTECCWNLRFGIWDLGFVIMATDYHPAPAPPPPLRPPPNPPKPPPPPPPQPPPPPPPKGPTPLFQPLQGPMPQPPRRRRRRVRPSAFSTMKRTKSARTMLPPEPTFGARSGSGRTPCSVTLRPCAMRAATRDTPASRPGP